MTVLGSGKEKDDDKENLVAKGDVATIMPNRLRLVKLKRRRTVITLILSIGFFFIFLCGIFLTVCFIKKIGPFRRHVSGFCPVGSKRFNGHKKVFESYEITDKYALIHVPRFNFHHKTFDSVRTLHVFDKKMTIIQHNDICMIKPMMKYQMLRSDWFDRVRMLSHNRVHAPRGFAHFHLRMVHPQLPGNYLRDKVHHLADAMCNNRPVFRLVFQIQMSPTCNEKCTDCKESDQVFTWTFKYGHRCRVCECKRRPLKKIVAPLKSSTKVDPNCKTIRCENKCQDKKLLGCVQCKCADAVNAPGSTTTQRIFRLPMIKNDIHLPPMKIDDNDNHLMDSSKKEDDNDDDDDDNELKFEKRIGTKRNKRSVDKNCKIVAKIYEGYTPLDHDSKVPLDIIYDC